MSVPFENIDDVQLRERLESLTGREIGPITYTTRAFYLKKLEKYSEKESNFSKPLTTKTTAASSTFNKNISTAKTSSVENYTTKWDFYDKETDFNSSSSNGSKYWSYLSEDSRSSEDSSLYNSPLTRPSLRPTTKEFSTPDYGYNTSFNYNGDGEIQKKNSNDRPNNNGFPNRHLNCTNENKFFHMKTSSTENTKSSKTSFLLLAAGLLIFMVIVYVYLYKGFNVVVFKDPRDSFIICPKKSSTSDICVEKSDLYQMQELMSQIIMLTKKFSGDYECGYRTVKGMTRDELINFVDQKNSFFRIEVILTILIKNLHWKIETLDSEKKLTVDIDEVELITNSEPKLPLKCRLQRLIKKFFYIIIIFSVSAATLIFAKLAYNIYSKRVDLNQEVENDMTEKVLDILKQHDDLCKSGGEKYNPWLPILYVRDLIVPLSERKSRSKLWQKVINNLKRHESKLVFKVDTVRGEDYEVMKWQARPIPTSNPTNNNLKTWQGSAISGANCEKPIKKLYPPLTSCLKVRNMFNMAAETGNDWKRVVRDAILEKVGPGHGIINLVVDGGSNEGCVYIRCLDERSAGEVFDSLHGWWFDNRLVTVKYLRLQRFLERFPEGANNMVPLRPSNEARLSLSIPYPRSVLENS